MIDPTADFFAALRRMKARQGSAPALVPASDQPRGQISVPEPIVQPGRAIGPSGLALIKQFEGCAKRRSDGRFEAYPDPGSGGDPWTIGWGATGKGIGPGTVWTQAECDQRLEQDLLRFSRDVARALGNAPTTQAQFDALVSFHYNTGAIAKATLTRLHKAGDHAAAQAEFGKWVHAGGRRLNGLVRRRAAEASFYAGG